jgi:glycosyltransferase involved in cell wall biosynthesis
MLKRKFPVALHLVGGAECESSARRLKETIHRVDPHGEFIHWLGDVPHEQLPGHYHNADGFVFASSCENLPNILLEAMAAGLPIACSDRGPMPEVLGPAGVYFNPERTIEIAAAIQVLAEDQALRKYFAAAAYARAQRYSWERTANETFSYLATMARSKSQLIMEQAEVRTTSPLGNL